MAIAIFSVVELIYDKSKKGCFLHKIRKRGWLLIFCALLIVAFNFYKDWMSDRKQEKSDKAKTKADSSLRASQKEIFQLQLSTKNSIIKKVDSTYTNSIKASNEALAKYNLTITDSLHSVISKLKLDAVNPQLMLAPLQVGKQPVFIKKDNGKITLCVQFLSKGGTSYHIFLKCYLLKGNRFGYAILKSDTLALGGTFLAEDIERSLEIDLSPDILSYSELLVFLTGSFSKDPQGKITIPYNDAVNFNFKENKISTALEMDFNQLKKDLNIK